MSTCRCLCGVDKEEKNDAELCCMYACCAPGCSVIIPCACVDTAACVAAECGRHAVKHGKAAIDTGAEVLSECCQKGGGMCCTRSPDNEIQTFEVGTKNYVEQVIMRLNKLEHGLKEEEMKNAPSLTTTRKVENMAPEEEKDSPSNSGKMVRSDAKPTNLPKKEGAVVQ